MAWITQAELLALLHYNPLTGELTWNHRPDAVRGWNAKYAGKPALNYVGKQGYKCGAIGNKSVRAHRVIWKMVYGTEPDQIDHEDHDKTNNRLINLVEATQATNAKNHPMRITNKSGVTGVHWFPRTQKWVAYIGVKGKAKNLGYFETIEEAAQARQTAMATHDFHPNHGV